MCNRCIYEGQINLNNKRSEYQCLKVNAPENIAFTALIVQDLKEMLDRQFEMYQEQKNEIRQKGVIDSDTIVRSINSKIEGFFSNLDHHLDSIKTDLES